MPSPCDLPSIRTPPTVIVLASGRGERFRASGGATHKLHALLHGKTLLQHALDAVQASGLPWHLEDAGHPGMGDSIAAGVRATPDAHGWMILPADLPLIRPCTLRMLATAWPEQDVVAPVYQGQRGHPVRFAAHLGAALMALSGDCGAAEIARRAGVSELPVDDVGCVTDIDTVDDLRRAGEETT
ncbi:MAG: nucleotidyltransferase family protein [Burkholderiaceae bacterium]